MNFDSLKNCELFKGFNPSEFQAVEPLFKEKSIEEGKTVFIENMPGEALYLIEQGTVQVTKMLAEGDELTLIVLGPEEVFGEMALLESGPRMATARVVENVRLFFIDRQQFESFCDKEPLLGLKLMRNVIRTATRRMRENYQEYREMLLWSLERTGS